MEDLNESVIYLYPHISYETVFVAFLDFLEGKV